ncbi:hypothetical protein E1B28_008506 [Marasmius oreades]|uniref:Uncharacterized protein n=1 Tax=Marasmius oreades TaxID=181124 RepID=A0A9P7URU6_9AGAR|nr:uncharacterized protein E1B28_008506 [Marasmius oreades]KAG7092132.1 hypothetical protein E1B28_008506 [Marasmius oreades]
MKVFLPAIAEYIPEQMAQCLATFLDFCYLVRQNDFTEDTIKQVQEAIDRFHALRVVFIETGIREGFLMPRMHAMMHYPLLIMQFGALNGVCSSITESRHITAVKRPWQRSNQNNALSQILLTNRRNDKLAALRSLLAERGLIPPIHTSSQAKLFERDDLDEGPDESGECDSERLQAEVVLAKSKARHLAPNVKYPHNLKQLVDSLHQRDLPLLARRFLYEQLHDDSSENIPLTSLPDIRSKIEVFHSAVARFFAPSDTVGIRGMHREQIRSCPLYHGKPRYDMVSIVIDDGKKGFLGMSAARVLLFFSFKHKHNGKDNEYPCALVHWFDTYGRSRDAATGMWQVRPGFLDMAKRQPHLAVIYLHAIFRSVHLIPVYGKEMVPNVLKYWKSLDLYRAFYVNFSALRCPL